MQFKAIIKVKNRVRIYCKYANHKLLNIVLYFYKLEVEQHFPQSLEVIKQS